MENEGKTGIKITDLQPTHSLLNPPQKLPLRDAYPSASEGVKVK